MKSKGGKPWPTFEQFVAQCRESFSILKEFKLEAAPLPKRDFINEFQVGFTNGIIFVVNEGIHWGDGADAYFEDNAGVKVPLVLFIPQAQRKTRAVRVPGEPEQLYQIRTAGLWIKEHCADILRGDMA